MHKLYEYLCDELEELEQKAAEKGLSGSELEYADKLTEIKKNILKIEMLEDEGYSAEYRDDMMSRDRMGGTSYRGDGSYRMNDGSYNRGGSYARGRGRSARRDAMGRYSSERGNSRDGKELADELRDMMHDVTDERTRQKLQKFVSKLEEMD